MFDPPPLSQVCAVERSRLRVLCGDCKEEHLPFVVPHAFCAHCGERIKRNTAFYVDRSGNHKGHVQLHTRCFEDWVKVGGVVPAVCAEYSLDPLDFVKQINSVAQQENVDNMVHYTC
ncbi:hypothetical protein T492DRAFT_841358 [Pavlovales sp. CCMP2436]|nr:hypothetical protein T492DRAFT_841358 [Pavlovales sp. CCMP2436]